MPEFRDLDNAAILMDEAVAKLQRASSEFLLEYEDDLWKTGSWACAVGGLADAIRQLAAVMPAQEGGS